MKNIEKKKQDRNNERDKRIARCDVCNKSMSQRYYYEHIKTQKQKIYLAMKNNDENKLEVLD